MQPPNHYHSPLTGIDKIEFISKQAPVYFEKRFRRKIYREAFKRFFCNPDPRPKRIIPIKQDDKLYKEGYRTIIRLLRFNPYYQYDFWDYCIKHGFDFGKPWLLEIFADRGTPSEKDAIWGVEYIAKFIIMKQHPYDSHVFDTEDETTYSKNPHQQTNAFLQNQAIAIKQRQNDEKFYHKTFYWGPKNFQLKIYPRYLKAPNCKNIPVIHKEFVIKGENIRQTLGLERGKHHYFDALKSQIDFDSILKQHTIALEINEFKYAKHLLGMSNIKKLTQEQETKIQNHLEWLKFVNPLETAGQWVKFIHKNRHRYDRYSTRHDVYS